MAKITGRQLANDTITNTQINASAAIDFSKLAALTDGNILVGNASNVVTSVNPSGDIDVDNAGIFSIASGVIVNADVNASAAIAESKVAFDTTAGHDHDGTNSASVTASVEIWDEVPTGTINGTNQVFTVATAPDTAQMLVFLNGVKLQRVATASSDQEFEHANGATLFTAGVAPVTGDVLETHYRAA